MSKTKQQPHGTELPMAELRQWLEAEIKRMWASADKPIPEDPDERAKVHRDMAEALAYRKVANVIDAGKLPT